MIYLTGDTHGREFFKFKKQQFPYWNQLGKEDYVIILGDFGLLWDNSKEENFWLEVLSKKPWTTLFIDGNHENHQMISKLPTVEMFGDEVGVVTDSIYHLRRGRVYTIEGKSIFTMGGALSIDKYHRILNKSWWAEELILPAEEALGHLNLKAVNYQVDYVLTHTCPAEILTQFNIDPAKGLDPSSFVLTEFAKKLTFEHWYFGHLHYDKSIYQYDGISKFTCLYAKVIPIGTLLLQ